MRKRLNVMVCVVIFALLFGTLYSCSGKKTTTTGKTTGTSPTVKTTVKASGTVKTTTRPTGTQQTTGADSGSDQIADGETGDGEIPGEEPGKEDILDLGGRTITYGIALPIHIPSPDSPYTAIQTQYKLFKRLEEAYNCKFNVVASGDNTKFIESLKINSLAGTETRDCIGVITYSVYPWAPKTGYMTQLDSYFEKAPDKYQVLNQESTKWEGTQYGILQNLLSSTWGIPNNMMLYNRAFFEKEGMEDPPNLFNKRKWTWEEFLQLAITATRDINGDGISDQYGIGSFGPFLMNSMLYGNTSQPVIQNSDGRFVFNVYDRKCINAFQFIADLFNIYKVATDNLNIIGGKQVAFLSVGSNNYITYKQYTEGLSLIIPPSGPDADNKYVTGVLTWEGFFMIPSNVSDKDKIFRLFCEFSLLNNSEANPEIVGSQQDQLLNRYTSFGFQDPRDLDHVREIFNAYNSGEVIVMQDIMTQIFGLSATLNSILTNDIIKLRSPVSSVLETYNQKGQSIIDNLMK